MDDGEYRRLVIQLAKVLAFALVLAGLIKALGIAMPGGM